MEENEHVSHASFCDLQVVIRSASGFGEEDISAFIQVIYFMKRERKERFPGLQYSTKIPCPECNKLTIAWDPTDENEMKKSQHFCGVCERHVDLPALFSQAAAEKKPEQRLEEERSNDETSLAYQLMRPVPPNECLVMISFNHASAGPDAVELANFLTKLGYPTFCTDIFCGTQAGDWREYTEAGAMHCQFYIPQMTKLWQESNECQYETKLIIKNRLAKKEVTVIPVSSRLTRLMTSMIINLVITIGQLGIAFRACTRIASKIGRRLL